MANYPRTEEGHKSALRAVMWHTKMHDSTIYIYVDPNGKEYITSIIHPGDRIAEGTGVAEYNKDSFTDEEREVWELEVRYAAMQDAPDQVAAED